MQAFKFSVEIDDPVHGKVKFSGEGEGTLEMGSCPEVEPPEPPEPEPGPDLVWFVDADPKRPFASSQGEIPVGVEGKEGKANKICSLIELVTDGSVIQTKLAEPASNLTPTEARRGAVNRNYPAIRREEVDGRWMYRCSVHKKEFAWTDPPQDSFRSEVGCTGEERFNPWETEEFHVAAIQFDDERWLTMTTGGQDWCVLNQQHDTTGGLTHNPPAAFYFNGGAGNPDEANLKFTLRKYKYTQEQYNKNPSQAGNVSVGGVKIAGLKVGEPLFMVSHYVYGCGYTDPAKGKIYGPLEPEKVFYRVYVARGWDGTLEKVFDHSGFWGSPVAPSNGNRANEAGFWKAGVYCQMAGSTWNYFSGERSILNLGWQLYRASDNVGMTPGDVLAAFRAARGG